MLNRDTVKHHLLDGLSLTFSAPRKSDIRGLACLPDTSGRVCHLTADPSASARMTGRAKFDDRRRVAVQSPAAACTRATMHCTSDARATHELATTFPVSPNRPTRHAMHSDDDGMYLRLACADPHRLDAAAS
jgi:hypothetical protein